MSDYDSYNGDAVHDMWVDTTYEAHTGNSANGGRGGYSTRTPGGGAPVVRVRTHIGDYEPLHSLNKSQCEWVVRRMRVKIECQQSLIAKDQAALATARKQLAAPNLTEYHRKQLADKIRGYENHILLRQMDVKHFSSRIVEAEMAYARWRKNMAVTVWVSVAAVAIIVLIAVIAC